MPDAKKAPASLAVIAELILIGLWAAWVGREYLDFDPTMWPTGRELGLVIRTHYIWTLLPRCGDCVLWNGFFNGGGPAFAELQGAVLHPLVIVTTLLWGVVNGTKVLLVASLMMAGWAQLWLARVIRLSTVSRLWTAAMVVVGGHLAARMEHGVVGLALSTAACSLVIPPALDLAMTGRRRSAVLTAVTLALALLSGQSYLQLGLFMGVFPALAVVFLIHKTPRRQWIAKGFAISGFLAILMTAIFWVPLFHALPFFAKDTDPVLGSVQPLGYLLLNLVIGDVPYYYAGVTGRYPYPYLYANYIGWTAVLLAIVALVRMPRAPQRRVRQALGLTVGGVYLCASAVIFKLLGALAPQLVASLRYPTVISGLAVPLILALAGAGLDQLHHRFGRWLSSAVHLSEPKRQASLWLLVIAVPLVGSLRSAYTFSSTWLTTFPVSPEISEIALTLRTPTSQWIAFPYGHHFWAIPALDAGLKVTGAFSPWHWKGRDLPPAYLKYDWAPVTATSPNAPPNTYAYVDMGIPKIACDARATGGHIDVTCNAALPGTLVVYENRWRGWRVKRDGVAVDLVDNNWLSVQAPAGEHRYTFRYRPWDVMLGLLVTVIGGILSLVLWRYPVAVLPWIAPFNRDFDARWDIARRWWRVLYDRGRVLWGRPISRAHARSIALWTSGTAAISVTALIALSLLTDLPVNHILKRGLGGLFIISVVANAIVLVRIRQARK
jgi:hypothetical protein